MLDQEVRPRRVTKAGSRLHCPVVNRCFMPHRIGGAVVGDARTGRLVMPNSLQTLRYCVGLLLAFCAGMTPCLGVVVWDKKVIELDASAEAKTLAVVYNFKIDGESSVTFAPIKTSCGCAAAELTKQTWAPGESGELKVTFTIGDRLGRQEKTIEVATVETSDKPTVLTLRVDIPEKVICSSRMLLWKVGDDASEKSAIISAGSSLDISEIEFPTSPNSLVATSVEIIEPGRKYRVVMRPSDTSAVRTVHIPCRVRFANDTATHLGLYALIK